MNTKPTIIAVCGKGGVGKTSTSSMITKILVEEKKGAKILAIDADPAVGLATALGVVPTQTVNDIRNEVIEIAKDGEKEETVEILKSLDYKIFDALVESNGFAFLAIGRPESEGCYCKVNTYLRTIISDLANKFDYVVIDGEAGIEQINRRVMETVSHFLLVSDASYKGINVIKTISEVADTLVEGAEKGVVINRIRDERVKDMIDLEDLNLLNFIPEDTNVNMFDVKGDSLFNLPETEAVTELKVALKNFKIL